MDPIQALSLLGAAGALLWVLKLLAVDEKLHTDSEVKGLKADKTALWAANKELQRALNTTNEHLAEIVAYISAANEEGDG